MEHAYPAGSPALDFAGTLRLRREASPREMLHSPESLSSWFRGCGITDSDLPCESADVREAVALREAIYQVIVARIAGESYDQEALGLVNAAARHPAPVPQLTAAGRSVEATVQQALSHVARDAVAVLSGPEVPLLKECANPECTQFYIDHSRGARREWCKMDPCGNKIKAAAYRARRRASAKTTASSSSRS
ncbi:ABATE domain-containing protein [Streptomyces sp. NBC_01619]|uniref:CGNR zinc finger domain-containing protein n=1 Tax=Streptomyces pratisoli TaxID=3139917 RepID=A0ACC6QRF7_9ACTN|nr:MULTISPECIES: CGNR zinc finger domain-containing protein [unclassified Streptomyces]MCX4514360.1 ABATE domain-containing protein [Streptomyces sp. NBC_01619]